MRVWGKISLTIKMPFKRLWARLLSFVLFSFWCSNNTSSVQLLSHVRLCNPMDCSTPGFPVHHQLLELVQIHVHRVGDAIQPSHPLSSPSPPFNLSQHQGLFQGASSSHQVAKGLELQLQHQSFQWISGLISFRIYWVELFAVQGTLKGLLQCHSSKASSVFEPQFNSIRHLFLYFVLLLTCKLNGEEKEK